MLINEIIIKEYAVAGGLSEKFWYNTKTGEVVNMHRETARHHVDAMLEPAIIQSLSPEDQTELKNELSSDVYSYSEMGNYILMRNNWVRVAFISHRWPSIEAQSLRDVAKTVRMMIKKGAVIQGMDIYGDIRSSAKINQSFHVKPDEQEFFLKHPKSIDVMD